MASSRSGTSAQSGRTKGMQSTPATSVSPRIRRYSAYDDNFDQHMIDHNIYPDEYSHGDNRPAQEPGNSHDIQASMALPRASLSPSHFSDSHFRDFKRKNKTPSEGTMMQLVIPIIAGTADIPNEGHLPFTNLDSMTGGATVKAVPDYFDGAHPGDLDGEVRRMLSTTIVPTKHPHVPIAQNFFLEAKAPTGGAHVALRQALHDGACGARAMHDLQNFGEEEPVYDGNTYTYSSTYHDGILRFFQHHITAPITPGGRPEYHMTRLDGFDLTSKRKTCVEGIAAFRNLRDHAKRDRDHFIERANASARRSSRRHHSAGGTEVRHDEGSSPGEFVDCGGFTPSQGIPEQPSSPRLQPSFTDVDGDVQSQSIHEGFAQHIDPEKGFQSQGPSIEASESFATSIASKPGHSYGTRSKKGLARASLP